ncbi:hypothetical protein NECAME_06555 [Necator americanus]|uniref:Uncharacterized protein n=1 Tax=Necator americanus TaxID=51031 RepID=W2TVS8_NECAM|nr:hypothetical protein NECAME_06555 [Necator americanus]ETN85166.1 hypothetical protein NECAME_06555 [Necator americanus]
MVFAGNLRKCSNCAIAGRLRNDCTAIVRAAGRTGGAEEEVEDGANAERFAQKRGNGEVEVD